MGQIFFHTNFLINNFQFLAPFQFLARKGADGPALSMGVCDFQILAPILKF